MGLLSCFEGLVTGACNIIESAVGAIGRGVANIATSVVTKIGGVIGAVVNIVKNIGITLGIIEEKDNIEELGARACESELKPEKFDTTAEYISHLKNNVELDTGKFETRTKEEKLAHKGIGVAIMKEGIKEKTGVEISDEFLYQAGKNKLSGGEVLGVLKEFALNGFRDTGKFDSYMKNSLPLEERVKIGGVVVEGFVNGNKGSTRDEMEAKLEKIELSSDRIV